METYYIVTKKQFDEFFHLLEKDASLDTVPNLYVVGFDIEMICQSNQKDSFKKINKYIPNKSYKTPVCTIQLATKNICLIIHLAQMKMEIPRKLKKLITSESWLKTGVGIDLDLYHISQCFNLNHCCGAVDLRLLAIAGGCGNPSLGSLYETFVGPCEKSSKTKKTRFGDAMKDWSLPLDMKSLNYAAKDAIMSYQLYVKMLYPTIDFIRKNYSSNSYLKLKFMNVDPDESESESDSDDDKIKRKKSKKIKETKENFVGLLQEFLVKKNLEHPTYVYIGENDYEFQYECVYEKYSTIGNGSSKKEAKHRSAELMLQVLEKELD